MTTQTTTTTALGLATRLSMTVEAFGLSPDTEVVVFDDGSAQADVDGTVQRIDGYDRDLMARIAAAYEPTGTFEITYAGQYESILRVRGEMGPVHSTMSAALAAIKAVAVVTRAETVPGVRVRVVSTEGATCHAPPDRRVWAQVVRGLLGRTGVVLDRRHSARRAPGEPTHLRARVALDPREPETRRRVVEVPLAGLELLREVSVVEVPVALERWS